jgi:MSHA pilin protein MshA
MKNNSGFTLFELLIVLTVLGLLAASAAPRFSEFRAAAFDARVQQDLRNLAAAEE